MAGPIVRAADLLPQLDQDCLADEGRRWEGLKLIVGGYFKKVVIADNLALIVSLAFNDPPQQAGLYWWVIMAMFAIQIYGDFSGYSDIARGLGKWLGCDFKLNFNHPYVSCSIREFWQRWHISLSTWFRDYVYIPLGGSKGHRISAHATMWITMLVSGLWHGAAWTFVVWGALHALYLSLERMTRWPERLVRIPGGRAFALAVVLVEVLVAWVFFRSENIEQAFWIIREMFSFSIGPFTGTQLGGLPWLALAISMEAVFFFEWSQKILKQMQDTPWIEPIFVALLLTGCLFLRGPGAVFIYFQF